MGSLAWPALCRVFGTWLLRLAHSKPHWSPAAGSHRLSLDFECNAKKAYKKSDNLVVESAGEQEKSQTS